MRMQLITPPASEPITLADAKLHCRVTVTDDDAYITALIPVARRLVEARSHQKLITQTWDVFIDNWENTLPASLTAFFTGPYMTGGTIYTNAYQQNQINFPFNPIQSVTYVKFYDQSGTLETWGTENYIVSLAQPARIGPVQNQFFPVVADQIDSIVMRVVAGYGDSGSSVDAQLIHAVKLLVGHFYEHRLSVDAAIGEPIPHGIDDLIMGGSCGSFLFA